VTEPIPTQDAEIVAREYVHNIILKFGISAVVLTNQGSNILSELFQNTCKLLRKKIIHITAVQFPMVSFEFFSDILPVALWPWDRLNLSNRNEY
jgi:hypothetical protein